MAEALSCAQAIAAACSLGLDRLDAQLLLLHVLGKPHGERAWLIAHDRDLLSPEASERFRAFCQCRASGEPLAYIVGQQEFFGLPLAVDPRVLIPRPDTETLVSWALDVLPAGSAKVLDLGTGSGAIALALKHARPAAEVSAIDASAGAVAVARSNAAALGLAVSIEISRWFEQVDGRFDVIVSNPPYVREGDPHLTALGHEPIQALTAGADGLSDLRQIIATAPAHLQAGGWLLLEHGYDQAEAIRQLLQAQGFEAVTSRDDLAGIQRCSGGRWPHEAGPARRD
ncbi:MAG: peptide chain release factor N(5)-glutamine methyltransferase [Polaromonas sp.]|nr:peptide chain release factor N(5)-glutamine methyltransferase [Polaromonas sp.]